MQTETHSSKAARSVKSPISTIPDVFIADDLVADIIAEYVGTIRNKDKQAYAQAYLNTLRFGGKVHSSITASAKLEVRQNINAIVCLEDSESSSQWWVR